MARSAARPRAVDPIEALVQEHLKLKDEPLHLAIRFDDPRRPKEIGLFEVIGDFGRGHIDPDRRFLEVTMASPAMAELGPDVELRLVLTSPEELRTANDEGWPALAKLRKRLHGRRPLHTSDLGRTLEKLLKVR